MLNANGTVNKDTNPGAERARVVPQPVLATRARQLNGCVVVRPERQLPRQRLPQQRRHRRRSSATRATTGWSAAPVRTRCTAAGATTCSTPTTCMTVVGAGAFGDQKGKKIQPSPNDTPDTHPFYADRAYGGAGLDVLIANTGADRLIDWVGEFNSYIVPFAPFGIATVSRQVPPWLFEFLYALSASQGADPTRDEDQNAADPDLKARNGEPYGELGLITQKDHGLWQDQTGGPSDPQPGNIPGGARDVKRSADFSDGTLQTFAVDSGVWAGQLAACSRSRPQSLGQDAAAVWYHDQYLPVYYELVRPDPHHRSRPPVGRATPTRSSTTSGPTTSSSPVSTTPSNKLVIGYRDASGWHLVDVGLDPGRRQVQHLVRPARRGQRHAGHGHGQTASSCRYTFAPAHHRRRLVRPQQGPARLRLRQLARPVRQRPAAHPAAANDARPLRELQHGAPTWLDAGGRRRGPSRRSSTTARRHGAGLGRLARRPTADRLRRRSSVSTRSSDPAERRSRRHRVRLLRATLDFKFLVVDVVGNLVQLGHSHTDRRMGRRPVRLARPGRRHEPRRSVLALRGASISVTVDGQLRDQPRLQLGDRRRPVRPPDRTAPDGSFDNVRVQTNDTQFNEYQPGTAQVFISDVDRDRGRHTP